VDFNCFAEWSRLGTGRCGGELHEEVFEDDGEVAAEI